jgi:hypothetical protein
VWFPNEIYTFAGPDGRQDAIWVRLVAKRSACNKDIEKRKPDDLIEMWTAVSDGAQGDYTFYGRDGSIYVHMSGNCTRFKSLVIWRSSSRV